jgi:hypothetical protein
MTSWPGILGIRKWRVGLFLESKIKQMKADIRTNAIQAPNTQWKVSKFRILRNSVNRINKAPHTIEANKYEVRQTDKL